MKRQQGKHRRQWQITARKVLELDEELPILRNYLASLPKDTCGIRTRLICDVLLNAGLRVSELCNLRLQDTPAVLKQRYLSVYRGKGDKDRDVAISTRLMKELCSYIARTRPATLPRHVAHCDIKRIVFYSGRHAPYTTSGVRKLITKVGKRAGLAKHLTPHILRHTYATMATSRGMGANEVMFQMGHSSLATTQRYLHLMNTQRLKQAELIDEPLEGLF